MGAYLRRMAGMRVFALTLLAAWIAIVSVAVAEEPGAVFVPSTVSKEAADLIRTMKPVGEAPMSRAEWQASWAASEKAGDSDAKEARERYPAKIEKISIAGAEHLLVTPETLSPANKDRLVVYTHGGAHTFGSPESTLVLSLPAAHHLRARVLAVRYPLAWQSPHPASRDLVVEVYEELLESYSPRRIAMFGDSAGGGLLMSSILKLRDDGVAMPAVLGLVSPWADITYTGDSQTLHRGADLLLDYDLNLAASAAAYATGQDMKDPSISPVYADFQRGFPPSFISTGTRDLFLSHCARLQRKLIDAGITNQLVVYEGMWHVFQSFRVPEERDAWRDMSSFFERHWGR
jgi:monoterpene epsilon-lactone hydrolase